MTNIPYNRRHDKCRCGRMKLYSSRKCRYCHSNKKHSQIGRWHKW